MTLRRSLLPAVAALCLAPAAFAATSLGPLPEFALDRLQLEPAAVTSMVVGAGTTLDAGALRLSLAAEYEHDSLLLFRDDARYASVIRNRVLASLDGAFGVTDRLQVAVSVPMLVLQNGDRLDDLGVPAPASAGLMAPTVSARYSVLHRSAVNPVDVAAGLRVEVPIGTDGTLGKDAWSVLPEGTASMPLGPLMLSAQLGLWLRSPANLLGNTVGSELLAAAAANTQREGWNGEVSVRAAVPFLSATPSAEVLAGVRGPLTPGLELFALAGPGFGHAPGTPQFRLLLGVAYGTHPVPAASKTIPVNPTVPPAATAAPEHRAPAEVERVPQQQAAPARSAAVAATPVPAAAPKPCDAGQAHTPAQCPELDDDHDGILNRADKCPTVPGLVKYDGCPVPDSDHDGVLDDVDACPTVAGPAANKGCPYADTDHDGLNDDVDHCPQEAGPVSNQGCPVDTDGDGVVDIHDNCPKEPGPAANQGCPAKKKQLVVITAGKIEIKEKVYFALAKAVILPKSFNLLTQVAQVITAHPELGTIQVEGHTDSSGNAETNRKLSQARASAVAKFLTSKGVPPARLTAKGFGPDRPADTNATAAGRENNRRVEFTVGTIER